MHYKFLQYFITSITKSCLQNGLYSHEINPNTRHLYFQICFSSHTVMALWFKSLLLYATYENMSIHGLTLHLEHIHSTLIPLLYDTRSMSLQLANVQCTEPEQEMWFEIWMEGQAPFYSCSTNLEPISCKMFSNLFCSYGMIPWCIYPLYFMYSHPTGGKIMFGPLHILQPTGQL
jgi:hypothetical protein